MERLTKNIGGVICYVGEHKQNDEDVPAEMTTGAVRDVLTSLFVYEEAEEKGRLVKLPENTPDIDFMRLFELIMADAEKRVMVLPFGVGKEIFSIRNGEIETGTVWQVEINSYTSPAIWIRFTVHSKALGNIDGHTRIDLAERDGIYLTRESAEAALQKTT